MQLYGQRPHTALLLGFNAGFIVSALLLFVGVAEDAGYLGEEEVKRLVAVIQDFLRRLTQKAVEESRLFLEVIQLACGSGSPD